MGSIAEASWVERLSLVIGLWMLFLERVTIGEVRSKDWEDGASEA